MWFYLKFSPLEWGFLLHTPRIWITPTTTRDRWDSLMVPSYLQEMLLPSLSGLKWRLTKRKWITCLSTLRLWQGSFGIHQANLTVARGSLTSYNGSNWLTADTKIATLSCLLHAELWRKGQETEVENKLGYLDALGWNLALPPKGAQSPKVLHA